MDQEPCSSVSLGTRGHVLPEHMHEELTRFHLVRSGFFLSVCLMVLLGWVLLLVAALISLGPGWRVRVWRWARPSDGFWRWHRSRRPLRATGRKFSGRGRLRKWSSICGNVPGTLALVELPSSLRYDTYLLLNLHRARKGIYGHPFWRLLGES